MKENFISPYSIQVFSLVFVETIYDCSSESYANLIELLAQCEWVDPEERREITELAPYMTVVERQQISDSLMIEAGQLLHSSEVET